LKRSSVSSLNQPSTSPSIEMPLSQATIEAKAETQKPTIIMCKTIIGLGSPNKQGKDESHRHHDHLHEELANHRL
jgi:transketolase